MTNKAIVYNTKTVSSKANKEKYQELKLKSAKMGKCDLIPFVPKVFLNTFLETGQCSVFASTGANSDEIRHVQPCL